MTRRVLFYRDYRRFSGGHLKVFDYFNHTKSSNQHQAEIYLTPTSSPDHPWRGERAVSDRYDPESASILFIAGMDWIALAGHPRIEERVPVINLIQHLRHADPNDPRHQFLSRRATRICVSAEVADALEETGICNGPIHVIPNGIDFTLLPDSPGINEYDIFIGGLKQPELAAELARRLRRWGLSVDCESGQIERGKFLTRMSRGRVAVLLPNDTEGFYLPALEAMAMGCAVICPDCGGNRSFCIDRVTALTPLFEAGALEEAVLEVVRNLDLASALRDRGREVSLHFDIRTERDTFLSILHQIG